MPALTHRRHQHRVIADNGYYKSNVLTREQPLVGRLDSYPESLLFDYLAGMGGYEKLKLQNKSTLSPIPTANKLGVLMFSAVYKYSVYTILTANKRTDCLSKVQ